MNASRSVVVLYEDEDTRQETIRCFDALMQDLWTEYSFEAGWASFQDLADPDKATELVRKARGADYVVFAVKPEGEFSFDTHEWIERWLSCREDTREGALIGLVLGRAECCPTKEVYLRNLASKIGMDFLTHLPREMVGVMPDSLSSYTERASQVTGVLDEILHHPPSPPREWGRI